MEIGEPIDQGRFGLLSQDDSGHLLCHVCGRGLLHLGTHMRRAHGLSADDYRERYGLTSGTRLVAERVRELMSQKWLAKQGEHLARLEAHRDPVAASRAARGSEAFSRVQYRLLRQRAFGLSKHEVAGAVADLGRTTPRRDGSDPNLPGLAGDGRLLFSGIGPNS